MERIAPFFAVMSDAAAFANRSISVSAVSSRAVKSCSERYDKQQPQKVSRAGCINRFDLRISRIRRVKSITKGLRSILSFGDKQNTDIGVVFS
jgi:hypothetical protein